MWLLLIIVVLVSSALSWRLVGVIVESSTDQSHREIARKTLIGIWGSSVLGSGTITVVVRLYELGILGP